MGRSPRFTYADALHHVTMRCNNKEFLFDDGSRRLFLDLLARSCLLHDVALYNYCILTNHLHLLFKVFGDDVLSKFMHHVSNRFARKFNASQGRNGHLWEGRFRSTIVQEKTCFWRCMAYVDLNPVRAGIVRTAQDYAWSGHRHITAEDQSIIRMHPYYLACAADPAARRKLYLDFLKQEAAREAYSLANALFMGDRPFVRRLEERFALRAIKGHRTTLVDLGEGIWAVELRRGGRLGSSVRPLSPPNQ